MSNNIFLKFARKRANFFFFGSVYERGLKF